MEVSPDFWRGRRVFLTGHTGFKGAWLSLWLQRLGAEIGGYALAPNQPSLFAAAEVGKGMRSVIGDIRDLAALRAAVAEFRPEIVLHLAAQPLVRLSYEEPIGTFASNVMGTAHLLEAVRAVPGVRAVINVTTDKCYENREWHWGYRENEPLGGRDPYSSSKACSELVTAAYRASFFPPAEHARHGVAVASARAGNVIGGGDWAKDRLVPDIVAALIDGSPARIRHPQAIRPWQHVLEPLAGYLILAQRLVGEGPAFAEAWNFGPPDTETKPVAWIADRLIQKWGGGGSWVQDGGSHPHEATYLKLDISKARARLGWQPRLSLDQTLGWLADWYRAWAAGVPMRAFTEGQIEAYTTLSASIS